MNPGAHGSEGASTRVLGVHRLFRIILILLSRFVSGGCGDRSLILRDDWVRHRCKLRSEVDVVIEGPRYRRLEAVRRDADGGGGETAQEVIAFFYDLLRDYPEVVAKVNVALEVRYGDAK